MFSGGVNLLMLAGPLYMLQVYDRVLSSRSVPTLVALTLCLVGAYAFQAALDVIRTRIVVRAATLLDRRLETTVHAAVVRIATRSPNARDATQPVRDLDQIRTFLPAPDRSLLSICRGCRCSWQSAFCCIRGSALPRAPTR